MAVHIYRLCFTHDARLDGTRVEIDFVELIPAQPPRPHKASMLIKGAAVLDLPISLLSHAEWLYDNSQSPYAPRQKGCLERVHRALSTRRPGARARRLWNFSFDDGVEDVRGLAALLGELAIEVDNSLGQMAKGAA